MRRILVFVVCCISAVFAYANDGAFYAEGTHLIPITDTDIRVQKEVLTLNRVDDMIDTSSWREGILQSLEDCKKEGLLPRIE